MKNYLLVFDGTQVARNYVKSRIDSMESVGDWIAFFDNTFCIASDLNVAELSDGLRAALPDVRFIVTSLDPGKRNGWLPKSVWEFMNRSKSARVDSTA